MRNVLIAAALVALAIAAPAMAEEFPAPPNVTFNNPLSWGNGRPQWSEIPDFAIDCENGDAITVSHQRGWVAFEKSGSEYKIDGTDAHYQNVPDRFGNQQMVMDIDLIEGGPSTHPTWTLSDTYGGGMWYFSAQQRPGQVLKCLPR
jgi:hypothetical protein